MAADSAVYLDRLSQIRALLKSEQLEAVLLFSRRNDFHFSRWLAGVGCGSAFHYLIITPQENFFLEVSYRAEDLRDKTFWEVREFPEENQAADSLRTILGALRRIGVAGSLPYLQVAGLAADFVDLSTKIEKLMVIKESAELAEFRSLAADLKEAFQAFSGLIRTGCTEQELNAKLRLLLLSKGESLAFPTSILSGQRLLRSTCGCPTTSRLEPGHAVLVDGGIERGGLYSDMTRMYFLGASPLFEPYQELCSSHRRVVETLRAGISMAEVVDLYRCQLKASGLPEGTFEFQDLGHGIGFSPHEPPFVGQPAFDNYRLEAGSLLCLEPEIALSIGRIRVEDMVLLHDHYAEIIT